MSNKNKNAAKVVDKQIMGVDNNTTPNAEAKELEAKELEDKELEAKELEDKEYKASESTTYIMNVTHLAWGAKNQSHFYAYKKPVISRKVMGRKHSKRLDIWLKAGHVEKGKY